jgi:hypothetical protein
MPVRHGTLAEADRLGIPRREYVISAGPVGSPALLSIQAQCEKSIYDAACQWLAENPGATEWLPVFQAWG